MAEAAEALKDWEKRAKNAKRAEKEGERPSEATTAEQGNAESDQPEVGKLTYPYQAPAWQNSETV